MCPPAVASELAGTRLQTFLGPLLERIARSPGWSSHLPRDGILLEYSSGKTGSFIPDIISTPPISQHEAQSFTRLCLDDFRQWRSCCWASTTLGELRCESSILHPGEPFDWEILLLVLYSREWSEHQNENRHGHDFGTVQHHDQD
jgi:hypothetical protein